MPPSELVLQYVVALVPALAWPFVLLVLALVFKGQIVELTQKLTRAKLPGGTELEFQARRLAEQAAALPKLPVHKEQESPRTSILDRVKNEPQLGLAELRIQLESALRALYQLSADVDARKRRVTLGHLVQLLEARGDVPAHITSLLRDVIPLANRAVHGEAVSREAAENVAEVGVRLLEEIRQIYVDRITEPDETFVIQPGTRDRMMDAQYRVTTIVPLMDGPYVSVRSLDQDGLDAFLKGYDEHAEFLVAIEPTNASVPKAPDVAD